MIDAYHGWLRASRTLPPGYYKPISRIYSLKERLDMLMRARPEELRWYLRKYADLYYVETSQDLLRCVAFLPKPLAEILDELNVPREWRGTEYIEFFGPWQPFVGPPEPPPFTPLLRRVIPGEFKGEITGVQPLMDPVPFRLTSLRFSFDK